MRPPHVSPPASCRRRRPPAAVTLDARRVGVVGVAERLGDHRVAVVDRALDARGDDGLAGEPRRGRGPRRRRRRSRRRPRRWSSRGSGVEPAEPCVSTWMRRRPARRRPRGPRRPCRCARCRSGTRSRPPANGARWRASGVLAVAAWRLPAGGGGRGGRRPAGSSPTTPATSATTWAGVVAAREAVGELLLDQRAGQLGQQLEVGGVAAGGRGDQEGQVGGAVLRAELHARARAGRRPASGSRRRRCGSAGWRCRR